MSYTAEQLAGMGKREVDVRLEQLGRYNISVIRGKATDPYYDGSVTKKYSDLLRTIELERAQLLDRQDELTKQEPKSRP